MPWRKFLGIFLTDPRVIQKIADSWPVRKAARNAVYLFLRGKDQFKDAIDKKQLPTNTELRTSLLRIKDTVSKEVKQGFKELSKGKKDPKTRR
ncbi:hypothetical protein DPMN_075169 [Dreissena polymorpha]|uniref:Uncharacterized protein n=1 Tax=Dreissena polymorpha TaxID=45954 RepID=A0A9D3YL59_DREPO|nr:hypothetical protein DPMN_075169 [Dreissena polymorpha]